MSRYNTSVAEGALCIAFSVVLSYLKLFRMPQGGSITLELVPLILFAYRRGVKWGCGAGALAGLLQLFLGGYVVHPLQAVLDYPLASAAIGLAGLPRLGKITAVLVAGVAQFICNVLSGVVFFASYAPQGSNVWLYSIIYNGSFMVPKVLLSLVVTMCVWKALARVYPNR